jgi:hypothetical protein
VEKRYSECDQETILRLLSAPMIGEAWERLRTYLSDDTMLVRVFDAAWIAALDFGAVRIHRGARRKAEAKIIVEDIADTVERLNKQLDRLKSVGGGWFGAARFPDCWPDNPSLRSALSELADRCERFLVLGKFVAQEEHLGRIEIDGQPKRVPTIPETNGLYYEDFVNSALYSQKSSENKEYARALIAILKEIDFPFGEKNTPPDGLSDIASAAIDKAGGVSYDDLWRALRFPDKKTEK